MMVMMVCAMIVLLIGVSIRLSSQREYTRLWQRLAVAETERASKATTALHDLVVGVEAWGREEDGVPEDLVAYDRARELLGLPRVRNEKAPGRGGRPTETERLRAHVAALVQHENSNGHCHARRAVWDADNREGIRGQRCARCHAFADARAAVGLSRWDVSGTWKEPMDGPCPLGCGCGAEGGG